jgi:hypothetical protein
MKKQTSLLGVALTLLGLAPASLQAAQYPDLANENCSAAGVNFFPPARDDPDNEEGDDPADTGVTDPPADPEVPETPSE